LATWPPDGPRFPTPGTDCTAQALTVLFGHFLVLALGLLHTAFGKALYEEAVRLEGTMVALQAAGASKVLFAILSFFKRIDARPVPTGTYYLSLSLSGL
jgi:hypothetical protein